MAKRGGRANIRVRILALGLMGAGLILAGLALVAILLGGSALGAAGSTLDLSVVPVAVDFPAPALALPNLTGQTETLDQYRGRVVLVNNWATWCPPCKAEMPTLQAYYAAHASEGLTVIAIEAGSSAEEVREFARTYSLEFPVWVDQDTAALEAFRNGALPNSYVIDRRGMTRLAWVGEIGRSQLEQYVTPLLTAAQ